MGILGLIAVSIFFSTAFSLAILFAVLRKFSDLLVKQFDHAETIPSLVVANALTETGDATLLRVAMLHLQGRRIT